MPDFLQRITSDAIEGNAVGIGQLSVPMDGSPGQVLATNGNGVLMWVDQTAGSGSGSGSCDDTNTKLLIHSDTLSNQMAIIDSSFRTHPIQIFGDLQHSTAQNIIGVSSIQFDGNGDYISMTDHPDFQFGVNDFTIEFWFRTNGTGNSFAWELAHKGPPGSDSLNWWLGNNGSQSSLQVFLDPDVNASGGGTVDLRGGPNLADEQWHHLALVRNGNSWTHYVDGTAIDTETRIGTVRPANGFPFNLGICNANGAGDFNGHMDEIRISDVARYTADFTPQTTAFCQDVSSTSFTFQGTDSGYTIGGHNLNFSGAATNLLDKFSFTSGNVASSVNGGLTSARHAQAAQKSATHGYATGGNSIASPGVSNRFDTIDKFPFASESVAVATHGTLASVRSYMAGGSSGTHGYVVAGTFGTENGGTTDTMEKFTVASDSDSVVITGVLSTNREQVSDSQSATHGYVNGGVTAPSIQKYSFSSDANSVVYNGDLLLGRSYVAGQSSEIKGYVSGGTTNGSTTVTNIEQYSFASESNATDVGVLSLGRYGPAGTSSTTDGYNAGGLTGDGNTFSQTNNIDKFSFASNNDAVDHADLSQSRSLVPGTQF